MRGAGPAERRVLILSVHTTDLDLGVGEKACQDGSFANVRFTYLKSKVSNTGMGRVYIIHII